MFRVCVFDVHETPLDLAAGWNFPDALTGGPHAGITFSPIVLTRRSPTIAPDGAAEVGLDTLGFLEDVCDEVETLLIFGGPAAVSEDAEDAALEAATCDED